MTASTREQLADRYLHELRRVARRLPRSQRAELVAEVEAHLAHGLAQADTEAAVRNLLNDLGDPEDIVAAALPPQTGSPARGGGVALALGLIGAVVALVPVLGAFVGIPLGVAAIMVGTSARRQARRTAAPSGAATGGIVAGAIAVVAPLLIMATFLAVRTEAVMDIREVETDLSYPEGSMPAEALDP